MNARQRKLIASRGPYTVVRGGYVLDANRALLLVVECETTDKELNAIVAALNSICAQEKRRKWKR